MIFTARKAALSGVAAALYVVLTLVCHEFSFGVQFRASEALTLLPFLFPETIPGLFAGCMLSNLFSPFGLADVVIGSLATLTAAILTARCKNRWLAAVPPVVINAAAIGALIALTDPDAARYGSLAIPFWAGIVGAGQFAVCFGLGVPLIYALEKAKLRERLHI